MLKFGANENLYEFASDWKQGNGPVDRRKSFRNFFGNRLNSSSFRNKLNIGMTSGVFKIIAGMLSILDDFVMLS